ncbi:carbonyl reductase [Echinococcus granulosus]|uniref:Carbonyl reductase n=1 Tax=Echinococcus granulosus TaxID=6210 RepID=W6URW9_ECHGR|nr:carbonyl reductase [Echinococcus granulosus]EUB61087.1 carbonyl reductase [Echinococcus granulosus]
MDLGAVKVFEDKGLHFKFHQLNITDVDSRHKLAEFIRANYPNGIDIMVDFKASRIGTSNLTFVTRNWLSVRH